MATFHENLKQSFKNFKNKYIGNVPSGVTLAQINADLTAKVSGFSNTTYSAVTGLAYDSTNNKLGLKVGADTVIPFSSGYKNVFMYVRYSGDYYYNFGNLEGDFKYTAFTTYVNASDHIAFENDYVKLRQVNAHRHIVTAKQDCLKIEGTTVTPISANTVVVDSSTFHSVTPFCLVTT
jgi:hypothetical protein